MKEPQILFVFGPARGGTTFVGNILDNWFDVGTGPEGTFIKKAVKEASKIGSLSEPANRRRYAEYLSKVGMLEIIRSRYPEGKRFSVTADDILTRMPENTVSGAVYAVFKAVADYRGKRLVGNKNPGYWKYLPLLNSLFPTNSKFLFVMRDGRDVALSLRGVAWGGESVYEAALAWKKMVNEVRRFRKQVPESRLLTVRYEDLVTDPTNQLLVIGEFLEADNKEAVCREYKLKGQPDVKPDNYFKWKREMKPDEVRVFEAIAARELAESGYECQFENARLSPWELVVFSIKRFYRLAKLNLFTIGAKLPQDKAKWQKSRIRRFLQPGKEKKG